MGIDYVPSRRGVDIHHLNWGGHELVARTLDLLGADLASWSGANDGTQVTAATCRQWANLLTNALSHDLIRLATVRGVRGRERAVPIVGGVATGGPGSLSADCELIDVAFGGDRFTPSTPTFPMDAARRQVFASFAAYLADCGGCRQR